mmetsp:Transcript_82794/g.216105  ORF Transcript_82794/g.216105 Transcript_82794/m.216105 type:complete len:210 (-) Transcript_82794:695-1324(-)
MPKASMWPTKRCRKVVMVGSSNAVPAGSARLRAPSDASASSSPTVMALSQKDTLPHRAWSYSLDSRELPPLQMRWARTMRSRPHHASCCCSHASRPASNRATTGSKTAGATAAGFVPSSCVCVASSTVSTSLHKACTTAARRCASGIPRRSCSRWPLTSASTEGLRSPEKRRHTCGRSFATIWCVDASTERCFTVTLLLLLPWLDESQV